MSVIQRKDLEASPLADLHAIASELGLEGYRGLRKADLVAAILKAGGGDDDGGDEAEPERPQLEEDVAEPEAEAAAPEPEDSEPAAEQAPTSPEELTTGMLDVLPNGSGFIRLQPGTQSREDAYVSPAQIRRCELRAGDEVSGPVRPPRRNERHPSLVRVEAVNGGEPEPSDGRAHFGDLTPVFPAERLAVPDAFGGVPVGKGSRVAVGGPPGAGATTLLREVATSLSQADPEVDLAVVLVGVRPEEVTEWRRAVSVAVTGGSFERSIETQVQAAELAVERAKRRVERGGDAVVVIDSLEALPPAAQRRVFGAARRLEEGGSLTIFAATGMAWEVQRHATTRVMLEPPTQDAPGPRVALGRSGTLRADLLS